MRTPSPLAAALGVGFYRYWHVPSPDGAIDGRATGRADLSVIGPAALAVLSCATWALGRVGASLLLDQRVAAPLTSLPWTARLLVAAGVLGTVLAALWWLATAPLRARVARAVTAGSVVRLPDDPTPSGAALHAAATQLGRSLRDLSSPRPLTAPAFEVLLTAAWVLAGQSHPDSPSERRLRRRCLTLARRLDAPQEPARPRRTRARNAPGPDAPAASAVSSAPAARPAREHVGV